MFILKKIENSINTIKHISDNSPEVQLILQKMAAQATALTDNPPKTTLELLTLEGIAAMSYFRYWYTLSLKWKGLNRKPIPQEWYQIGMLFLHRSLAGVKDGQDHGQKHD